MPGIVTHPGTDGQRNEMPSVWCSDRSWPNRAVAVAAAIGTAMKAPKMPPSTPPAATAGQARQRMPSNCPAREPRVHHVRVELLNDQHDAGDHDRHRRPTRHQRHEHDHRTAHDGPDGRDGQAKRNTSAPSANATGRPAIAEAMPIASESTTADVNVTFTYHDRACHTGPPRHGRRAGRVGAPGSCATPHPTSPPGPS